MIYMAIYRKCVYHTVTPHCHTTLPLHTTTPHYHSSSGGCSSSGRYMPHHIVTGVVLVVGTRGGGHYLLAVYLSFNSLCGSDVICLWKELTKNRKDQQICLTLYVAFSQLPILSRDSISRTLQKLVIDQSATNIVYECNMNNTCESMRDESACHII